MRVRRFKIRQALSLLALGAAALVTVATSPAVEHSRQAHELSAVTFDSESQVVEGAITPDGAIESAWDTRRVTLGTSVAPNGGRVLAELYDDNDRVLAWAIWRPDAYHDRATSEVQCVEDRCRQPVRYRIQAVDGTGAQTVQPRLSISFTDHDNNDLSDPTFTASEPIERPRSAVGDGERTTVTHLTDLAISPGDPMAGAFVTIDGIDCAQEPPRVAILAAEGPERNWGQQIVGGTVPVLHTWTRDFEPLCEGASTNDSFWITVRPPVPEAGAASLLLLSNGPTPDVEVVDGEVTTEPFDFHPTRREDGLVTTLPHAPQTPQLVSHLFHLHVPPGQRNGFTVNTIGDGPCPQIACDDFEIYAGWRPADSDDEPPLVHGTIYEFAARR